MNADKITNYLGLTDEVTTCECCGKSELKATVALETLDGGIVHYGTTCATRALGIKRSAKPEEIKGAFAAKIKTNEYREKAIRLAQKEANKTNAVIYVCRDRQSKDLFYGVREAAFDANPLRYGSVIKHLTPQ